MSKMSWAHAELSERASELGFESIEQAKQNGYQIVYKNGDLVLMLDPLKAQEVAHRDYLKRKEKILDELRDLRDAYRGVENTEDVLDRTITFIEEGEI